MLVSMFGFDQNLKTIANGQETTDWLNQTITAKEGFFFCWLFITAILLVLSFIAMIFYPLHGKKWNEDKERLSKEHQEKEEKYEQEILQKMNSTTSE